MSSNSTDHLTPSFIYYWGYISMMNYSVFNCNFCNIRKFSTFCRVNMDVRPWGHVIFMARHTGPYKSGPARPPAGQDWVRCRQRLPCLARWFGERCVPAARFGRNRGKNVEKKTTLLLLLQPTLPLCLTSLKQHHRRNDDERATSSKNTSQAGSYTLRTKSISAALVRRGVCVIYIMLWKR